MRYVTYLRVSTKQQGQSGLGLEAQRSAVQHFTRDGEVLAEYVEVESGTRNDRPELARAMAHARKAKAKLVIAKLDRLARNVHFISGLIEAKVDFVAVDMPAANKAMLQMMAVFAEMERDMISKRTTDALAAARARGVKLGGYREGAAEACTAAAERRNAEAKAVAVEAREAGMTLVEIVGELAKRGIKAPRGGGWSPTQVRRLLH